MDLEQIFQKGAFKLLFRTVFGNGIVSHAIYRKKDMAAWLHTVALIIT